MRLHALTVTAKPPGPDLFPVEWLRFVDRSPGIQNVILVGVGTSEEWTEAIRGTAQHRALTVCIDGVQVEPLVMGVLQGLAGAGPKTIEQGPLIAPPPVTDELPDLFLFVADGIGGRPYRREVVEELQRWQVDWGSGASQKFMVNLAKAVRDAFTALLDELAKRPLEKPELLHGHDMSWTALIRASALQRSVALPAPNTWHKRTGDTWETWDLGTKQYPEATETLP
eukprot:Skav230108  [mRNA]  locus=scaffold283:186755:191724:- [translate_table: standard]